MNTLGHRERAAVLHGGLLLAALAVFAFGMPGSKWPWYMLVPLISYAIVALAIPSLRRTLPRLSLGATTGIPLAVAAALCVATVAALVGFQLLLQPEVATLAASLPVAAFQSVVLAGVCFCCVNAALEELIFRGIFWEAVASEWNDAVAVCVTAVLFGLGHFHGYPSGPLGAVLAGLFGVALGLLRWWTGGLGLALACHICADATIFCLLANSGAFDSSL